MTASDPRVGEIQARLAAAELGKLDYGPDESGSGYHLFPHDSDSSIAFVHDVYNAALFTNAPADVAYLLAELRDRDEKLARVEALCDAAAKRGIESGPPLGLTALRAAVAAANGGGE